MTVCTILFTSSTIHDYITECCCWAPFSFLWGSFQSFLFFPAYISSLPSSATILTEFFIAWQILTYLSCLKFTLSLSPLTFLLTSEPKSLTIALWLPNDQIKIIYICTRVSVRSMVLLESRPFHNVITPSVGSALEKCNLWLGMLLNYYCHYYFTTESLKSQVSYFGIMKAVTIALIYSNLFVSPSTQLSF